jgi:ATP-dependent protease ClpP protease subunit
MTGKRLDKNKLYKFWNFNTLDDNSDTTELMLYSNIAEEQEYNWWTGESTAVTPKAFKDEMNAIDSNNICVRINSNGGSVFAASAIATMLRDAQANGKTVTCKIDGICASAAVLVAIACGKIMIAESAYMMIHDPMNELRGLYNATEMREMADTLDTIKAGIVAAYVTRTGLSEKECEKLMTKSTWFTGKEAVEKCFADEIMFEANGEAVENNLRNAFVNFIASNETTLPNALKRVLDKKTEGENTNMEYKNYSDLKTAFPDMVDKAEQEIRNNAIAEATKAERDRLKAIDALAGRIDGAVLNDAKYGEKPLTADEVIVNAFKENKMIASSYMNAAKADAENNNGVKAEAEGEEKTDEEKADEEAVNALNTACKNVRK